MGQASHFDPVNFVPGGQVHFVSNLSLTECHSGLVTKLKVNKGGRRENEWMMLELDINVGIQKVKSSPVAHLYSDLHVQFRGVPAPSREPVEENLSTKVVQALHSVSKLVPLL